MADREKAIDCFQAALRMRNEHGFCILPFEPVEDALSLLKAQETGGWISVKDRMPEEGYLVLVAFDVDIGLGETRQVNTAMNIEGVFCGGGLDNFLAFKRDFKCVMDVTHWMPLPKPPEEG